MMFNKHRERHKMQLNNFKVEYHRQGFGSPTGGFVVYGLKNNEVIANSSFILDQKSMGDLELICDFITASINEIIHHASGCCKGVKLESMS